MTSRNDHISKLKQDLDACREICSTVDSAKFSLNERLKNAESLHHKADEERVRLLDELSEVKNQLEREQSKMSSLNSVLSDSRQECMKLTIDLNDLKDRLEESEQKSKHLTDLQ